MKPQQQPAADSAALEALGRASAQVVHDLKNQLNGLKLYATFLRKRAARPERPADELETIDKIVAGLDRAAADANALVRLGRAVELNARPGSDLAQILASAVPDTSAPAAQVLRGDFDAPALTEALRAIDAAVAGNKAGAAKPAAKLSRDEGGAGAAALVEWETEHAARILAAADSLSGSDGLRVALAQKIVRAHGGHIEHAANSLRVRLPLTE